MLHHVAVCCNVLHCIVRDRPGFTHTHIWHKHSCDTHMTHTHVWHKHMCNTHMTHTYVWRTHLCDMVWLRLVCSFTLWVSFAKEPYKTDDILQKRPTTNVWHSHDSYICVMHTPLWHKHMCDTHMTHTHMCDTNICVTHTWLLYTCDAHIRVTQTNLWHT